MSDTIQNSKPQMSIEDQALKLSEMKKKEMAVRHSKIEKDFKSLEESKKKQEDLKKLDLFTATPEFLKTLQKNSKAQFENAKKKLRILSEVPELSDVVPFQGEEMILIGARTGTGKTTSCVNITHSLMMQGKRPLVITNEESATSFINKLSSLFIGKRYAKIDQMDDETKNRFVDLVPKIASRISVIDADYAVDNGLQIPKLTNTIEGLETIVDNLINDYKNSGRLYDAVIIDYYQKFNSSSADPKLGPFECQSKAAELLEKLRIGYPAPIVVFAQVDKDTKESSPFEQRIQGRKIIVNFATVIIEMIVDKKMKTAKFEFHKGRNMDFPDEDILCGWRGGKYVRYDEAFIREVASQKLESLERKIGDPNGQRDAGRTEGAVTGASGGQQSMAKTDGAGNEDGKNQRND